MSHKMLVRLASLVLIPWLIGCAGPRDGMSVEEATRASDRPEGAPGADGGTDAAGDVAIGDPGPRCLGDDPGSDGLAGDPQLGTCAPGAEGVVHDPLRPAGHPRGWAVPGPRAAPKPVPPAYRVVPGAQGSPPGAGTRRGGSFQPGGADSADRPNR